MLKNAILFISSLVSIVTFAAPIVTDVVAKQRYPWNGLVDITCRVSGITGTVPKYRFFVEVVFPDSSTSYEAMNLKVMRNGSKSGDLSVSANDAYHLLWDAKTDLGDVHYSNIIVRVTVIYHERIQLWKDGPYWATMNVGAKNPEDYGYYFWWGDTVGYKRQNNKWVASNGSNSNFNFSSGKTPTSGKDNLTLQGEGWITAEGVLAPEHDAAHAHWGGDWRMPTTKEFNDLIYKCDWTWTTMNGVKGYIVRGKGSYASANIFLPCAGCDDGVSLGNVELSGHYWSSVPYSSCYYACYLHLGSRDLAWTNSPRFYGLSVRPLQGVNK